MPRTICTSRAAGFATLLLCVTIACTGESKNVRPKGQSVSRKASRVLELVRALPANAPRDSLRVRLDTILVELRRATPTEMPDVRTAIDALSQQPHAVEAIALFYDSLKPNDFDRRTTTIQVLGELRSVQAAPFLRRVAWEELPAQPPARDVSTRDLKEILQTQAVYGIGFLRTPEAFEELTHIMQNHEARSVQIAAVESFMWNRGDTLEAATELYRILPVSLHPFVERPRFQRGMNVYLFNDRVDRWQKRWATSESPKKR